MDNIYRYEKSRNIRPDAKRNKILNHIFQKETWIIEGAQTKDWTSIIWKNCDVVILPNPSVIKRFFYIIKRHIKKRINGQHDGGIWLNIRGTLQFKNHDLLKFQKFAKQYIKIIIKTESIQ